MKPKRDADVGDALIKCLDEKTDLMNQINWLQMDFHHLEKYGKKNEAKLGAIKTWHINQLTDPDLSTNIEKSINELSEILETRK